MRRHAAPSLHVFVCANQRDATSPLGTGCAQRGKDVYAALKEWVAQHGLHAGVWVTETQCLGICPPEGCTIALYPDGEIVSQITTAEAVQIIEDRWAKTKR